MLFYDYGATRQNAFEVMQYGKIHLKCPNFRTHPVAWLILFFQAYGGTGFFQRLKRLGYDIVTTVVVSLIRGSARKLGFGILDQVRHKPACTVSEKG